MPIRVEDIAKYVLPVAPDITAGALFGRLQADPTLLAIPVILNTKLIGIVTRVALIEGFAGPEGRSGFAHRSIMHIMNTDFVTAEHGTPVGLVAKRAADEGTSALTEGVVVLEQGAYSGVVCPADILVSVANENAARARAMQAASKRLAEVKSSEADIARDKSRFLAFLSHEIRTPLTGIIGVADLLQDSGVQNEPKRLAHTISESGKHLDRLLSDLLDLSRLEAGKLSVTPEAFDLNQFAREAKDLWQSRSADKRLDLRISVDDGAIERVEADAMRIRQILFNLMSNALKFTEKGYVSARLKTLETNGVVHLIMTVADTGCGISDADKARMFQAFEQVEATTVQKHGGSGLGLSIAKGITAHLGGEIRLADNPGGGTIFKVALPVHKAGPRLAIENVKKPRMRKLKLGRILLADDHEVSMLVIKRALTAAGWKVDTVGTAAQAIRRASERPYQAILTDIHMPDDTGDLVARTLRVTSGPNQYIPILAVTADTSPERRTACDRAGFTAMIEKPVHPRALVATLADILMSENDKPALHRAISA